MIYAGDNDGSRVPPGWQAWLRGTIDELPDKGAAAAAPLRARRRAQPDRHGEPAYRPGGALGSAQGVRPASTGDYQAWTPD